jgi:hypothetical protein
MKPESRSDARIGAYTRWVIRHRWWVLAAAMAVAVAAGVGARNLGLSTDYRTFFSEDNPDLLAYERVEDVYTKNDNVLFVIKPRDGSEVFTPRTLEAVRELTEDAWQIPHSTRVDGITNFQHTWAEGDNLIVEDLLPAGDVSPDAAAEPLLAGRLIARDGKATGINVRINLPGESQDELPATAAHVRQLERDYAERYPELEIKTTGVAMLNMAFAEAPDAQHGVRGSADEGPPRGHAADVRCVPAGDHRGAALDRRHHRDARGHHAVHDHGRWCGRTPGRLPRSNERVGADDHPDARRGRLDPHPDHLPAATA